MTESKKRTPRETQTREKTARRKPWAPPSMLEAHPHPKVLYTVGSGPPFEVRTIRPIYTQDCAKVGNPSGLMSILISKLRPLRMVNTKA